MIKKVLIINGVERTLVIDGTETLAKILRDRLLLTGCKIGCGEGHCGACNVILDGKVTRSCIVKAAKLRDYAEITTIEGIGTINDLHPCRWRGWPLAARSAVSAARALSSAPRRCSTKIPAPPAKRCAPGSTRTATSAAARATSPSSTPPWPPRP